MASYLSVDQQSQTYRQTVIDRQTDIKQLGVHHAGPPSRPVSEAAQRKTVTGNVQHVGGE